MKLLRTIESSFRYGLGSLLLGFRRFDSALRQFRYVASARPDWPNARARYAHVLAQLGRFDEAVLQYERLLSQVHEYADGYSRLGSCLQQLGRHDEAISAFRAAIDRDPADALSYYNLGGSYLATDKRQDALVAYRRAAQLKPDEASFVGNLGVTFGQLGHWEEAVEHSRRAFAMSPTFESARNLGIALAEINDFEAAEDAFRTALQLQTEVDDTELRLALVLSYQDKMEEAIALVLRFTKGGTQNGVGMTILADLYRRAGKIEDSLRTARAGVAQYPMMDEPHGALGMTLLESFAAGEALQQFDIALKVAPENIDYLAGRGAALSLLSRHSEAVEVFDQVILRAPTYFDENDGLRQFVIRSRSATDHG